jgi:hypothetical protein
VAVALKRASTEWSPPQQMWPESGVLGVGGVVSWHPESLCVPICRFVSVEVPIMQETWSKIAATATNAATLTANWTIERMPMRSSQNQGSNINSTVSLQLLALHKSSVLKL